MTTDSTYHRTRGTAKKLRCSKIITPQHAHPFARLVFILMRERCVRYAEVEERSSVLSATIKSWRHRNVPGLNSIQAVLGAMQYELVPTPVPEAMSPELREDLEPLAEKHSASLETLAAGLVSIRALRDDLLAAVPDRLAAHKFDGTPLRRCGMSSAP